MDITGILLVGMILAEFYESRNERTAKTVGLWLRIDALIDTPFYSVDVFVQMKEHSIGHKPIDLSINFSYFEPLPMRCRLYVYVLC